MMDSDKFERLVNSLDSQLAQARQAAERRAQREPLERRLKNVQRWRTELGKRKTQFADMGIQPTEDLNGALAQLEHEEFDLEEKVRALQDPVTKEPAARTEAPPAPRPAVDPALKDDLYQLVGEIRRTELAKLAPDERKTLYAIWCLRWRVAAERIGQDATQVDREMRAAFRMIREAEESVPEGLPYQESLNSRAAGDWGRQLDDARRSLGTFRNWGERGEAEEKLLELKAIPSRHHLPEDEEGVRILRHLAREVARTPSLRDDLAEVCGPWRVVLGPEFDYLWADEAEAAPAEAGRRLSNRDIMARILRRMRSKALIGACHGPLEKIWQGFPGHDTNRAKEAIEILVRCGALRKKSTEIGFRISIEPAFVGRAENFCAGAPFGVAAVDAWCESLAKAVDR